jgi:hypothetical protein
MNTIAPDQMPRPSRAIGVLSIVTGIASVALLANHPGGEAHSFADVLKNEAANQMTDAVVHGGFIAILAVQMVVYAMFSARLGFWRTAAMAGFIFFAMGTAFLSASMVLDGLVTPTIAAKYLAAPDKLEFAKSLFAFVGTMIRFLMPIGLAFQSVAIVAWSFALFTSRTSRAAGIFGIVAGLAMLGALAVTAAAMNPFALMGSIAGTALWAVVAGLLLMRTMS